MKKIIRIMGGLGNQMFQYALARSIQINEGCSVLLDIDCKSGSIIREYILDRFTVYPFKNAMFVYTLPYKIFPIISNYNILTKAYEKRYGREIQEFVYQDNSKYKYLDGYWQNCRYFFDIRDQLISDFSCNPEFDDNSLFIKQKIVTSNSVAVHVRRGDYLSDINKDIFVSQSMDYYINSMQYVRSRIDNPEFFFFSDDIEWCKENFNNMKNITFVDCNNDAVMDFEMLRCCKHKIISNSTFSWWAAWLQHNENVLTIAPNNWYKDKKVNEKCKEALLADFVLI